MPKELINKTEYETALHKVDALTKDEIPTHTVRGREIPVEIIGYKSRQRKIVKHSHFNELAKLLIVPMVAAGYPNAICRVQRGKLIILLHGCNRGDIL